MAFISEDRVDLLEEKLRSKVDTMTGFSDVEGKSRALEKVRNARKGFMWLRSRQKIPKSSNLKENEKNCCK